MCQDTASALLRRLPEQTLVVILVDTIAMLSSPAHHRLSSTAGFMAVIVSFADLNAPECTLKLSMLVACLLLQSCPPNLVCVYVALAAVQRERTGLNLPANVQALCRKVSQELLCCAESF